MKKLITDLKKKVDSEVSSTFTADVFDLVAAKCRRCCEESGGGNNALK